MGLWPNPAQLFLRHYTFQADGFLHNPGSCRFPATGAGNCHSGGKLQFPKFFLGSHELEIYGMDVTSAGKCYNLVFSQGQGPPSSADFFVAVLY